MLILNYFKKISFWSILKRQFQFKYLNLQLFRNETDNFNICLKMSEKTPLGERKTASSNEADTAKDVPVLTPPPLSSNSHTPLR